MSGSHLVILGLESEFAALESRQINMATEPTPLVNGEQERPTPPNVLHSDEIR